MIDMIGVAAVSFDPLIVGAMVARRPWLGWILRASFRCMRRGLVWAEKMGAASRGAGGVYRFSAENNGTKTPGTAVVISLIWQLSSSAPLSIASGCASDFQTYASYYWPGFGNSIHPPAKQPLYLDCLDPPGALVGERRQPFWPSASVVRAVFSCSIEIDAIGGGPKGLCSPWFSELWEDHFRRSRNRRQQHRWRWHRRVIRSPTNAPGGIKKASKEERVAWRVWRILFPSGPINKIALV